MATDPPTIYEIEVRETAEGMIALGDASPVERR
jgi:hypothetical protein